MNKMTSRVLVTSAALLLTQVAAGHVVVHIRPKMDDSSRALSRLISYSRPPAPVMEVFSEYPPDSLRPDWANGPPVGPPFRGPSKPFSFESFPPSKTRFKYRPGKLHPPLHFTDGPPPPSRLPPSMTQAFAVNDAGATPTQATATSHNNYHHHPREPWAPPYDNGFRLQTTSSPQPSSTPNTFSEGDFISSTPSSITTGVPISSTTQESSSQQNFSNDGQKSEIPDSLIPPKISASSQYATYNTKGRRTKKIRPGPKPNNFLTIRPSASEVRPTFQGPNNGLLFPYFKPEILESPRPAEKHPFMLPALIIKTEEVLPPKSYKPVRHHEKIVTGTFSNTKFFPSPPSIEFLPHVTTEYPAFPEFPEHFSSTPPTETPERNVYKNDWIPIITPPRRPIIKHYHVESSMTADQQNALNIQHHKEQLSNLQAHGSQETSSPAPINVELQNSINVFQQTHVIGNPRQHPAGHFQNQPFPPPSGEIAGDHKEHRAPSPGVENSLQHGGNINHNNSPPPLHSHPGQLPNTHPLNPSHPGPIPNPHAAISNLQTPIHVAGHNTHHLVLPPRPANQPEVSLGRHTESSVTVYHTNPIGTNPINMKPTGFESKSSQSKQQSTSTTASPYPFTTAPPNNATKNPIEEFNAEYFLQLNDHGSLLDAAHHPSEKKDEIIANGTTDPQPTRRSSTILDDTDVQYTDIITKSMVDNAKASNERRNRKTRRRDYQRNARSYDFNSHNIPTVAPPTVTPSDSQQVITTLKTPRVLYSNIKRQHQIEKIKKGALKVASKVPVIVYPEHSPDILTMSHVSEKTLNIERLAAKKQKLDASPTEESKREEEIKLETTAAPPLPINTEKATQLEIIPAQGHMLKEEIIHYHAPVRTDGIFV